MKTLLTPLALLVPALLHACRSPEGEGAALSPARSPLPQSSFAALVRSLETLDASRIPEATVQVRAVECDSLIDRGRPAEYARVYLHLTVYAADVPTARRVFEDLRTNLEAEARSPARVESVSGERVRRVFQEMAWKDSAPAGREPVSYSDSIRIEVQPGHDAPADAEAPREARPSRPAPRYVEEIAREQGIEIDRIAARSGRVPGEMRCRLAPAPPDAHYSREQIGSFLRELEARSPAARLTHIEIERNSVLADVERPDGWTFEAELTLRGTVVPADS